MSDVTSNFSLYDSEILRLEQVLQILNRKQGTATNLEGFRQEILDRMALAGFRVDVKVYSTTQDGTYAFDVEIKDRMGTGFKWDHDRMVHEVTNDILDLGAKGVIKTTKDDMRKIEENTKGHGKKHC